MIDKKDLIPLMVPDIREEDISAVVEVLRSGLLVQGKYVELLEAEICRYLGVKHAVAVSSGTASLHLALLALGIGQGDEVIVPAFSFIATANVVEIVGAKPVFVDIDIKTFNIDTIQIEAAITPRTRAIMPVHEFGLACDISEVCRIAEKHNLAVIEDAACALGATENGKFAGTFGNVGSFSFHPRKAITSGEGGMLVTNDDQLADEFKMLRNHGISNTTGKMEFVAAGLNYRMTDFQASLLGSQFTRLECNLQAKERLAIQYLHDLQDTIGVKLPIVPDSKRHSWQSFHLMLDDYRDECIDYLGKYGIGSNYGAQCIPCQRFFRDKYSYQCDSQFPNAIVAFKLGLALPLYNNLTSRDVTFVTGTLKAQFEERAKSIF